MQCGSTIILIPASEQQLSRSTWPLGLTQSKFGWISWYPNAYVVPLDTFGGCKSRKVSSRRIVIVTLWITCDWTDCQYVTERKLGFPLLGDDLTAVGSRWSRILVPSHSLGWIPSASAFRALVSTVRRFKSTGGYVPTWPPLPSIRPISISGSFET